MDKITFTHYDDGKNESQSHLVSILDEYDSKCVDYDVSVCDYDINSLLAYGSTKEEAIKNALTGVRYVINKMKELEKVLDEEYIKNNMVDVDCLNHPIKK
jgi:hypothetical protein